MSIPFQRICCRVGRRLGASLTIAAVACCAAGAASATDFSVGFGVGADQGRVDCLASMPCDHSSASWRFFGTYRVADAVDLQAAWFDAGRFKGADVTPLGTEFGGTFKVSGIGLTAGYTWSFAPAWSLAGRAGVASVRTRFDYAGNFSGSVSKTTTQPIGGVSLGYAFTPAVSLSLDYDATRFKVHSTHGSLQTLGVAARYSF